MQRNMIRLYNQKDILNIWSDDATGLSFLLSDAVAVLIPAAKGY
jgi:hypothetical protein